MSLAKKSIKWLVIAVIVCTLALSAVFALGVTAKASADQTITIYYYESNWTNVNAYAWTGENPSTKYLGEWPGTAMTSIDETLDNWFKVTVNASAQKIRFNNAANNNEQTLDLDIDSQNHFYKGGQWYAYCPDAEDVSVLTSITCTDQNFPGLLASDEARTISVKYYFSQPSISTSMLEGYFDVRLNTPNQQSIKPTTVTCEDLEGDVVVDSVAAYQSTDNSFFSVSSVSTVTDDMFGAENGAIKDDGYALFEATFTLPANAFSGEYTFSLTGHFSTDGDAYATTSLTAAPFYVRETVQIPTAITGLVYNGESQKGVADDVTGYTVVSGGSATNAGDYQATVALANQNIYIWSDGSLENKTVDWSIAKKSVTIPVVDVNSYTYDGQEKSIAFTAASLTTDVANDFASFMTISDNARTDVGSTTVTASLKNDPNANYQWVGGSTADQTYTLTVTAKAVTVSFAAADDEDLAALFNNGVYTVRYRAQNPANVIKVVDNGIVEGDDVSLGYTADPALAQNSTVGTYALTATATGDDAGNYSFTLGTASYVITPIVLPVPAISGTYTYTGAAQTATITNEPAEGYCTVTGSKTQTNAGSYPIVFKLNDTTNTAWDNENPTADVTVVFTIGKKTITKPTAADQTYTYNQEEQTIVLTEVEADKAYYTVTNNKRTNAGSQNVTVTLTDTANTKWSDNDANASFTIVFTIGKKTITKPVAASGYTYIYNHEEQTIVLTEVEADKAYYTVTDNTRTNAGSQNVTVTLKNTDNTIWADDDENASFSTIVFTIEKMQITKPTAADQTYTYNLAEQTIVLVEDNADKAYYTVTNNKRTNWGSQNVTVTLTDTDNTIWADSDENASFSTIVFTIAQKQVVAPTWEEQAFFYNGTEKTFLITDSADSNFYTVTGNKATAVGNYTVVIALKGNEEVTNTVWKDSDPVSSANIEIAWSIQPSYIDVYFGYFYGDTAVQYLAWDSVNEVLVPSDSKVAVAVKFGDPVLQAPAIRWFKTTGFKFEEEDATTYSFAMENQELVAEYTYDVGLGDINGDKFINVDDIRDMRLQLVTGNNYGTKLTVAEAWTKRADEGTFFLNDAFDVNASGGFNAADVVRVREAIASGYGYFIVNGDGVTGQKIVYIGAPTGVSTLEALLAAVKAGRPVVLENDITAEGEDFEAAIASSAEIDLGGFTLSVNEFTLTSASTDVTLSIKNGTIYTIEDITISAPNGNVKINDVEGYHYAGQSVNLTAYSSSLHFEGNVEFYTYQIANYATAAEAKTAIEEQVIESTAIATAQAAATNAVEEKKTAIETAKQAVEAANEEGKAAAQAVVEQKIAELKAVAAPVTIPASTHVVVEEQATLVVEKINVQASAGATTFTIDVKDQTEVTVSVDTTAANIEVVNIAGENSKVDVAGEVLVLDNTKNANVATIDELLAAIAKKVPSIVLIDDITTNYNKPVLFDYEATLYLNGKTFTSTNDVAIRTIAGGNLTIEGAGNVVAQEACVMAFDGSEIVINGGTFTAIDNFVVGTNGTTGRGNNTITINGGIFNGGITSNGYIACGVYVANNDTFVINGGTFNITGGIGILARSGFTTVKSAVVFNLIEKAGLTAGGVGDKTLNIPVGKEIAMDLSLAYYPGGLPVIVEDGGKEVFVIAKNTNGTVSEVGTYVKTAADLQATTGGVIVIGADLTGLPEVDYTADTVLYLNGKNLTFSSWGFDVSGGAKLVINANGGGSVTSVEACATAQGRGELTINGGTFTARDNFVFGTQGNAGNGGSKITVNDGVFNGGITSAGYVACGIYVANSDTVVVNGGTFNITNGVGILSRSGNTTIGEDVTFNMLGESTDFGKIGDSRVVLPAGEALVLDLVAGYPGGIPMINNNSEETVYVVANGTYAFVSSVSEMVAAMNNYANIILTGDLTYRGCISFTTDTNLYLNGHVIYSVNSTALAISAAGKTLTIYGDGEVKAQEGCVMTFGGSNLVINGGTYTCYDNFVIGMNGSDGEGENTITINAGTFNGYIQTAGYVACGIYVSNTFNVYVNGGTFNIEDGCGILARSGNTVVSDAVVFNLTSNKGITAGKVGDSAIQVPTGAALVKDLLAGYPGGAPTITNNGSYVITVLE